VVRARLFIVRQGQRVVRGAYSIHIARPRARRSTRELPSHVRARRRRMTSERAGNSMRTSSGRDPRARARQGESNRTARAPCARLCGSERRRGSTRWVRPICAKSQTAPRRTEDRRLYETRTKRNAKPKTILFFHENEQPRLRVAAAVSSRRGFTVPGWRRACRSTCPASSAGSAARARAGICAAGTTPGPAPRRWSAPRSPGR
jgi:hypothetical protein